MDFKQKSWISWSYFAYGQQIIITAKTMIVPKEYQNNLLYLYQGPITVNLISFLGNYIQLFLNDDSVLLKRIFRIFVELTQNISYYSAEKKEDKNGIHCGIGWFSLQDFENYYRLSTGNLIRSEDGPTLKTYCKEINSLSEEQLRKLKRDIRAKALMKDVIAQVGLIQTGITSQNRLDCQITEMDKWHSFFILSAILNR